MSIEFISAPSAKMSIEFQQSYQHLYLQDFETDDTPPPLATGLERFSSSPSSLLVITRPDTEGAVFVEVFENEFPLSLGEDIEPIFHGPMDFPSGTLSITTVGAAEESLFDLPRAGSWDVQVRVAGGAKPWYVAICLR
ncbi:hypothetical protein [Kitasatospora sp. P5_F3]